MSRACLHGSALNDPLHGLPGDFGDPIEVLVVVKERQARRFGGRRDDEVRDGNPVATRCRIRSCSSRLRALNSTSRSMTAQVAASPASMMGASRSRTGASGIRARALLSMR
jgi:hypothetical protein